MGAILNVDALRVMLVCQQGLCKNDTDCSSEVAVNGGKRTVGQYLTVCCMSVGLAFGKSKVLFEIRQLTSLT
jgi:hypothetical protein